MVIFWILVAVLVSIGLAFILPPVLRARGETGARRSDVNITIFKDRLAELEQAHLNGDLETEAYEEARQELERELIDYTNTDSGSVAAAPRTLLLPAIVVGVVVPVAAVGIYLMFGSPKALVDQTIGSAGPSQSSGSAGAGAAGQLPHSIEEMVSRLAERLEKNPEDADGWVMLGRSYAAMNRLPAARKALLEADRRQPDNPLVLVALAEVEAGLNGNNLDGRPIKLVRRALEIDPNFPRALWLAGVEAYSQGRGKDAASYWKRMLDLPGLGDSDAAQVRQAIAKVEPSTLAAKPLGDTTEPAPPAASSGKLTVRISLAPELRDTLSPTDTLYVFARAAEGPAMPLAIVRRDAREFPVTVVLDDSMAMTPQMRLSAFSSVVAGARVSKSGNASPQPGDLSGSSSAVTPSQAEVVDVVISQVVE